MSEVSTLWSFCVPFLEHFAGSILEEKLERSFQYDSANGEDVLTDVDDVHEINSENVETDFTKSESKDFIFEEYTSYKCFNTRFSWKINRPSVTMSVVDSIIICSGIIFAGGIVIGGLSAIILYISMNTANLCHWLDDKDTNLPIRVENIRFASFVFGLPFVHCYSAIIFMLSFSWSLVKEHNLLLFCFFTTYLDVLYRLILKVFNIYTYRSFQIPYPLNLLTFSLCLWNGYLISRSKFPNSKKMALKLSVRLILQFAFAFPVLYFVLYVICPWYIKMPKAVIGRFLVVGTTGVILLLSKTVTRIIVSRLKGVVHPENSYILVSFLYGSSAITLRILQAELEETSLFCLMGVAHGIVHLLERASAPIVDYLLLRLYKACFRGRTFNRRRNNKYKTRRSQRFAADVSIQTIIYESSALVISIAAFFFYKVSYNRLDPKQENHVAIEFLKRLLSGLLIEWFFNIVAVFVQTRYMNVAIFSVWKLKWRRHLLVAMVTLTMTLFCFPVYLLKIVRYQFKQQTEEWKHFSENCTELPFSIKF